MDRGGWGAEEGRDGTQTGRLIAGTGTTPRTSIDKSGQFIFQEQRSRSPHLFLSQAPAKKEPERKNEGSALDLFLPVRRRNCSFFFA